MALRKIEVFVPTSHADRVVEMLKEEGLTTTWRDNLSENRTLIRALLDSGQTEDVLDRLQKHLSSVSDVHILILPVEAAVPRPELPAKPRISREELYDDIAATAKLDWLFLVMVVLSTIVAGIGLWRNNVAVIIGAMVIAPLLGPNMALCLATTLGDLKLGRQALKANLVGVSLAFALSLGMGYLMDVDPTSAEIASRTQVGVSDIILALAAGTAGALAFTTGVSTSLIGVMVAVALLPPLVTVGLLTGEGEYVKASSALLLLATNVICVSLAGVSTFALQGIRPRAWYDADKARRATRISLTLWILLLLILVAVVYYTQTQ